MFPTDTDFETQFTFETEANPVADNSPFQILLLGDWSGGAAKPDLSLRRPIEIDRDNFEDVMIRLKVNVELDLVIDKTNLTTLNFNDIEDFHPDKIFNSISHFNDLRELRRRLLDKISFEEAAREVRSLFNQTQANDFSEEVSHSVSNVSPVSDSKDLLDQILSQSNEKPSTFSPRTHSDEIQDLVEHTIKPFLVKTDENEQTKLLNAIDQSTSGLMRKILNHTDFQTLESAWLGLNFLVRQVETSTDLKIYIFDVAKHEIAHNLQSISSLTDSFLFQTLFSVSQDDLNSSPWSLLAGNYSFDCNIDDIALLMRLTKLSALAETPFISYIRSETLGFSSSTEFIDNDIKKLSLDTNAQKLWTTIRSLPESEYLGLATPRYLARLPYGFDTVPIDSFNFEEFDLRTSSCNYLWSNPCFISVILIAQTFNKYGWNMENISFKELDGFPVHIYEDNGETKTQPSVEVLLTSNEYERLLDFGVIPLFSYINSDIIRVLRFQSIASPLKPLRGKWNL